MANEIIGQTKSNSNIIFKLTELQQPQKVSLNSDFPCNTTCKDGVKNVCKYCQLIGYWDM